MQPGERSLRRKVQVPRGCAQWPTERGWDGRTAAAVLLKVSCNCPTGVGVGVREAPSGNDASFLTVEQRCEDSGN